MFSKGEVAGMWAEQLYDRSFEFDADRRAVLANWILSLDLEAN